MALLMVAASVYGVVQLLVLSSPTRSVRMSTALLAIAVGVYGAGSRRRCWSWRIRVGSPRPLGSR
ncbi:hypothetical protein ACWGMA_06590 [Streptomyces asiaticus]